MAKVMEEPVDAWKATHVAEKLGYRDVSSFKAIINEVIRTLIDLDLPFYKHVVYFKTENNKTDFFLSRFACYLCVMKSSPRKKMAKHAKERVLQRLLNFGVEEKHFRSLNRLEIRKELSDMVKWMNQSAFRAGVQDFASFVDSGYQGLYQMNLRTLRKRKSIEEGQDLFGKMGFLELIANLLRIKLSENYLRGAKDIGQIMAENRAKFIGQDIRNALVKAGMVPENLRNDIDLSVLKSKFKKIASELEMKERV